MTTRRLSEIDLAGLCALSSTAALDAALERYDTGGGAWSYNPVRSSTSDIVGAQPYLPGLRVDRPTWAQLETQIAKACTRGEDQLSANLEVGQVLYDVATREDWQARAIDMSAMPIGLSGDKVRFLHDVVIDDGKGPFVTFSDHRRNNGITNLDIETVVVSMQRVWIEARFPDLEEARLSIGRYPCQADGRWLRLKFHDGGPLLTYEELNDRVRHVYSRWGVVTRERAAQRRRTGTGG